MPKITIPIVGQAYKMPTLQLDAQTCINWYLSADPTGKFPSVLLPDPGLETWAEVSGGKSVRGLFELNGILYGVIDDKFYIFDNNGNEKHIGTLKTSIGNVRFTANDTQLFLTDTKYGYVYQLVDSTTHEAGDFFVIEAASSIIGDPTFTGSGLNDMTTGGAYTATVQKNYRVEIQTPGTIDTFRWSDSAGDTWNEENVQITTQTQTLNDGVQITFDYATGHTATDRWDFTATSDTAFYVPIIPTYQDTYGIYAKQVSRRWYISESEDFSRVNALDYAQANVWPDNLVVAISIREEVWLICRTTTEIWYDVGIAQFPFERRTNLVIKYGTVAPYSVAVAHNNILLLLGNNEEGGRVVIMMVNYEPQIISTEPLNYELAKYDVIDDAIGFTYQWNGHIFYCLIFPSEDKTWIYDLTTKSWHEKRSTLTNPQPNISPTKQGRWRANNFVFYNDKCLVGDFESGKIYKLSDSVYTENGNLIWYERATQHLNKNLHLLSLYSFQLDMQKGVGLTQESDYGYDPKVMLQISKDDGISWGNEKWKSIGKTGKYKQRIKWNQLGTSDSFTFKIRSTNPVYNVILGAVIEVEELEQ